jgi:sialic acid synthase
MKINQEEAYVIAEIGHNHQGKLDLALKLIKSAKECGVSAVKFQKRDNKNLYTNNFFNHPYENKNSFGKTYGLHREALELSHSDFNEMIIYAKHLQIDIFATPFDLNSLNFLEKLNMPAYKIASADITNLQLQKEIAKLKKTIFLSTGGCTLEDVRRAKDNICKFNKDLIILHCTASYPADVNDMNLNIISTYKKEFTNHIIGLSDHENGIDAASIAYMLGARVFEKHFTLDRSQKGTDNAFSLEPQGMSRLVRNLKRIPGMLGSYEKKILPCEVDPIFKMSKSIVAKKNINKGDVLNEDCLDLKSPGGGLKPYEINFLLGKKINKNKIKDELILKEDVF